ncbi:arginase family protein [Halolamina sp. CBA1230]|uniref:arginase family protein n=1 Tax=Halolamina sp. CBA1230 TaxID=1853690 RepID=UPI0009A1E7ED|nr:arginase family protein [Halolamina sp. CBA1230]QKY20977.1 arginase family protein [Halolamina sp. CBA1230]
MGFPGAVAEREHADYAVVGAPLDVSTTFQPGARFGPEQIRRFARTFDDYDRRTDQRFSDCGVHDAGDVRAWDDAVEYLEFLGGSLADLVRDGVTPLLLGGEHTVTAAGVRATDPDTLVVLDAHLDLREAYDGNPWSHAAVTRRALDGDPEDEPLSTVSGTADRAVILGARTGSEAEWERADRDDVTVVPPEAVGDWTPDFGDESVYLSVDIDGADPSVAPGTGTMEPFGLSAREMREAVRQVAPHAVGFDAVEVNDRDDGQAAALAGKLLKEFVFSHAEG